MSWGDTMSWDDSLPLLTLLTSLLPTVIIFLLREDAKRIRTVTNLVGATLKLALIGVMVWGVVHEHRHEFRLPILPELDLVLRADSLAMFFVTLSGLLWFLTTIYAIFYLEGSPHRRRFFGFFSLCVSATVGIALAGNLFTFVIFYELLTLSTYPLVVHRETAVARRAGRVYLVHTLAGGALLLFGAAWLHVYLPDVNFDGGGAAWLHVYLPDVDSDGGSNVDSDVDSDVDSEGVSGSQSLGSRHQLEFQLIFCLLIAGLGVKAALIPLHGWLPQAMVAPAPVSALLHAVAVVKAGAFGIVRVVYDVYGIDLCQAMGLMIPLAILAAATILYGSLRALFQNDLKKRLAFSTISQVSYIALGVAVGGPSSTIGGVAHLVHQGLMKITMFFCAGNLAETLGIHKISEMRGVGRRMPWTMAAFTVAAFGMIGVPPMAGFISKWYLGAGAIEASQHWVLIVLMASTALNAAYFLPILHIAWFGEPRGEWLRRKLTPGISSEEASFESSSPAESLAQKGRVEANWGLLIPPLATASLAVVTGLFAGAPISPLQWAALVVDRAYGRAVSPPGGVDSPVVLTLEGILLLAAIVTPLALACCLFSRRYRRPVLWLAAFAAVPALALACFGDVGTAIDLPWVLLHLHLGLDATGQSFLLFTSLLWLCAGIYAHGYLADDPRSHHFFGFFLLTMAGNFGLVLSLDMVSFYFSFAVMSFSAYGLIVHRRDTEAFRAGRVYVVLVVLGEILLFAGMVLATTARGGLRFDQGVDALASSPMQPWIFALLLVGLGIKAGVLPLHVWLPLAHPAAPIPASAVLSGAMIKAGLLGWLRFLPVGEAAFRGWGEGLLIVGSVTAVYAAAVGITQSNAKSVLAYSSISQMGLMTLGVGAGLLLPAAWPAITAAMLVYVWHHGISKGCLFLGVGMAQRGAGRSWQLWFVRVGLVVPALAMAGAPLTMGAVAKSGLKESLVELPGYWTFVLMALLPIVSIGTTLLMARFLYLIWPPAQRDSASPSASLGWPMPVGWSVLLFSIAFSAWLVPDLAEGAKGTSLLASTWTLANLWPIGLGVSIAWGGWRLLGVQQTRPLPSIPAGDILVIWQRAVVSIVVGLRACAVGLSRIRGAFAFGPGAAVLGDHCHKVVQRMELSLIRRPWIGVVFVIVVGASVLVLEL